MRNCPEQLPASSWPRTFSDDVIGYSLSLILDHDEL
jgi:hypothetical protein